MLKAIYREPPVSGLRIRTKWQRTGGKAQWGADALIRGFHRQPHSVLKYLMKTRNLTISGEHLCDIITMLKRPNKDASSLLTFPSLGADHCCQTAAGDATKVVLSAEKWCGNGLPVVCSTLPFYCTLEAWTCTVWGTLYRLSWACVGYNGHTLPQARLSRLSDFLLYNPYSLFIQPSPLKGWCSAAWNTGPPPRLSLQLPFSRGRARTQPSGPFPQRLRSCTHLQTIAKVNE